VQNILAIWKLLKGGDILAEHGAYDMGYNITPNNGHIYIKGGQLLPRNWKE